MADYLITSTGVRDVSPGSARADMDGGFLWSDIETPTAETREMLQELLGLAPHLVDDAMEACLIPKVRQHGDHLLIVTHALDDAGHLLGLHQIIGPRSLVTLHVRMNPDVQQDQSVREAERVLEGLRADPSGATSPGRLALLLVAAMTDDLEKLLSSTAKRAGQLDRDIREETRDNEELLDPLFAIRRDLVTVQNRLDQTGEAVESARDTASELLDDVEGWRRLQTRLLRIAHLCRGERDFFDGVLGLYELRINLKMNSAMERLALITVVLLPITAVAGIVGMNTITTDETNLLHTILWVTLMATFAGSLLYWARRQGWW